MFIVQATGVNVIKLFSSSLVKRLNKLVCPWKVFQYNLIWAYPEAYPKKETPERCYTQLCSVLTCEYYTRLDKWSSLFGFSMIKKVL